MMTPGPPGFTVPNASRAGNNYESTGTSDFNSNNHSNMISDSLDPLNAIEKSISDQVGFVQVSLHGFPSQDARLILIENFISQMPHTPLTPGSTHTPISGGPSGGPPSVPPSSSNSSTTVATSSDSIKNSNGPPVHDATTSVDLPSDLNFDPEAVIQGEAQDPERLNVSFSSSSNWYISVL